MNARAPTYGNYADLQRRKPVKWWHTAIIDDMLQYPLASNVERAARLGYSASYISIITNSDMFKAAYAARRAEVTQALDTSIVHKQMKVADQSLDLMLETLQKKRDAIPFPVLADVHDKTMNRLGYGVKPGQGGVNINVNAPNGRVAVLPTVSPEQLAEARDALRRVEQMRATESPLLELKASPDVVVPSGEGAPEKPEES